MAIDLKNTEIPRSELAERIVRTPEELVRADPSVDSPGTYCPKCEMKYIGRETVMGRPPKHKEQLTPIIRCDHCKFLHAWDKKLTS